MRMKRLIVPVVAAALTLTACNANPELNEGKEPGKTEKGGTLEIVSDSAEIDLDPAKSQNLPITTLGLIARRLNTWQIEPGKEPKVVPDLATDTGKPSDDGKTWTFTLKEDIKYADGSEVTARDVKYGVERSFAPELSGGLGYHKALLEGGDAYKGPYQGKDLASIETKGDKTIVFRLKTAYGDWPWIAAQPAFTPVPEKKDSPDTYSRNPMATGPYQVDSFKQGTAITLKRNPEWNQKNDPARTGGPDKVVLTMNQEATVVAQKLISDAADDKDAFGASFVPPAQLNEVQQNAGAKERLTVSGPGALAYLAMNTQRGVLKDVRVRKAIEYAVDKKAYQIASGGALGGKPATTLITPGIPGRQPYDLYQAGDSGNVTKAKDLLAQAGHAKGLNVTLLVQSGREDLNKAQAIQQGLKRAGITAKLRPVDDTAWTAEATGDKGDYDLTLSSWQPDFPSPNGNIQPLFASSEIGGGGYNLSRYSNPEVDALIDRATSQTDPAKAHELWAEADKKIMSAAPIVPLVYTRNAFLHGSNVRNFEVATFPGYPNYPKVSLAR